jgi:hypothetical protein
MPRAGRQHVNRLTYEICVLEALRERLRSKEIWVVGANRYRNPDEDLPTDFAAKRKDHYTALGLPLDCDRFITSVQDEMRAALHQLDTGLPRNPHVKITAKRGGWMCRKEEPVHPLAAEKSVVFGGRGDDRGRDSPLHGDGGGSPVRR